MDLVHVPCIKSMHHRPFRIATIVPPAFSLVKTYLLKPWCNSAKFCTSLGSIHLDLDLVSIRIAHPGGKSLAFRPVVHLRRRRIHTFALEGGDNIVNT